VPIAPSERYVWLTAIRTARRKANVIYWFREPRVNAESQTLTEQRKRRPTALVCLYVANSCSSTETGSQKHEWKHRQWQSSAVSSSANMRSIRSCNCSCNDAHRLTFFCRLVVPFHFPGRHRQRIYIRPVIYVRRQRIYVRMIYCLWRFIAARKADVNELSDVVLHTLFNDRLATPWQFYHSTFTNNSSITRLTKTRTKRRVGSAICHASSVYKHVLISRNGGSGCNGDTVSTDL